MPGATAPNRYTLLEWGFGSATLGSLMIALAIVAGVKYVSKILSTEGNSDYAWEKGCYR